MRFYVRNDEENENAIQLSHVDITKIKENLVITILDTVTDSIIDHVFTNPLVDQEKDNQLEFEKYSTVGIWTLVSWLYGENDATIKDIFSKYDGEVIYVGGDTKYYNYSGTSLPDDVDIRLIVVSTY